MPKHKVPAFTPLTINLKIEQQTLRAAINSGMIGGPHGYSYWCPRVRGPEGVTDLADHVLGGGTISMYEYDESSGKTTRRTLSLRKLLNGVALYLTRWNGRTDRRWDQATGITSIDIDAPTSDAIMQYALFGEQVYG